MLHIDLSSTIYPLYEPTSETFWIEELSEEDIISEMVDHDLIVRMSPVKEYTVRAKIKWVKKGMPRVVEPTGF